MASVKTAISLQKPLFDQVEALVEKMRIPRSRLFVLAVEEFLRRQHRQMVEGDW
jgi:metal-responsive CopG/Arc/MetJ family transcriptional regulator